ncbi:transcription elongation factor GreA [Acholeplasma sp. OttesenSCG-928-E16]|nr:transcription elongation factor GreA [Acholeplasma sp. OttesenSCG-928-E16]
MAAKKKQVYELTEVGFEKTKEELSYLKDVRREEILEELKEARAQGDLSENADYDAARNAQAINEARILELENIVKHAKIIKTNASDGAVSLGKIITVEYLSGGGEKEFQLVSTIEANPKENKISVDSPLGKAIRNCQKDDIVSVKSQSGNIFEVKIKNIK